MPAKRQPIPFGIFEVDLASGEIRRNGVRVRLQEQPFQVLAALLENPGQVVTKQELQERIWKDDTFVDFDRSLATAINKVRQALGDSATSPRFIETIPKRGYRFIGPGAVRPTSFPRPNTTRRRLLWAAAAIGLVAVAAGLYAGLWEPQTETVSEPMEAAPFTTYRGIEGEPTFSPDGAQIAFHWTGEEQNNWDIYLKLVGAGEPIRLTTNPDGDYSPSWSPDATRIAFLRGNPARGKVGVFIIPALGGRERKLAEIHQSAIAMQVGTCLDWSPDSLWLAVCDGPSPTGPFRLFLLSVETGEMRQMTVPPEEGSLVSDINPAFSPDGRTLAFARGGPAPVLEIYLLDLGDDFTPQGEPRQLTSLERLSRGPVFTADGRDIVFDSGSPGDELWTVPVSGAGPPQRMPYIGNPGRDLTVSRRGNRAAYVEPGSTTNIWRVDLPVADPAGAGAVEAIVSTSSDYEPRYSPDGTEIAFGSDRSGNVELWKSDADGRRAVQLTAFGGPPVGGFRWSPDGENIVFMSVLDGQADIFAINASGGAARRLTSDPSQDVFPWWSQDGEWIYFDSQRSGDFITFKMPATGGEPLQAEVNAVGQSKGSPDGKVLYYAEQESPFAVSSVPLAGGEPTRVVDATMFGLFDVVGDGIYFVAPRTPPEDFSVHFRRFSTGAVEPVFQVEDEISTGISVSPDGRSIVFGQEQYDANIMLVENFR